MANYKLRFSSSDLSRADNFLDASDQESTMIPGAEDSVDGNFNAGHGSLNVDTITNFTLLFGTVTAKHADYVTVGNFNAGGGPSVVTINGTIDTGAVVFGNGTLTADGFAADAKLQGRGGTINFTHDLATQGPVDVFTDIDIQGGVLNVNGALSLAASGGAADAFFDDGAIGNVISLVFGSGKSTLSLADASILNVSGVGPVQAGATSQAGIGVSAGAKLNAANIDLILGGVAATSQGSLLVDDDTQHHRGEATLKSLDLQGGGKARVVGGKLTVSGEIKIGFTAGSTSPVATLEVFGINGGLSTVVADALTVGFSDPFIDDCGDWSYEGTRGLLGITSGGSVSVLHTLVYDNPVLYNDPAARSLGVDTTSSLHVGGSSTAPKGTILVDGNGQIIAHGIIFAPTIINNGIIAAAHGILDIRADFDPKSHGKVVIDEFSTARLSGKFAGTAEFHGGFETTLEIASAKSLVKSGSGLAFTGKVSGISEGDTITFVPGTWGSLAEATVAHTEYNGSKLVIRTTSNKTISFAVTGGDTSQAFNYRELPETGQFAFTAFEKSDQIKTGVSGKPAKNPYLDAIIEGWAKWLPEKGAITYALGSTANLHDAIEGHGDTVQVPCDVGVGDLTSVLPLIQACLSQYQQVCGITFAPQGAGDSIADANIVFWDVSTLPDEAVAFSEFLSHQPSGHLWISLNTGFWDGHPDYVNFGGVARTAITHEIGHALGLAHPFDGGYQPDRTQFKGVRLDHFEDLGEFAQNQDVYTIMSYNRGLVGASAVTPPRDYGGQGGLGAFDIAALQKLYGTRPNNTDDTPYTLQTTNAPGTGWKCIWDTAGIDTISNENGTDGCTIDLRPAPLKGEHAGGYISHVDGIAGGFTIAAGVTIENATGGDGDDTLIGNSANNTLIGNAGKDTLTGGLGKDTLTGGLGLDTFKFGLKTETPNGKPDIITDFSGAGLDGDQIDVHGIDANAKSNGNQNFKFIGTSKFHHKAGELHYVVKSGFLLVEGDIDGNGKADFQIEVHGAASLSGADFVL